MINRNRHFVTVFFCVLVTACQSSPIEMGPDSLQKLEYRATAGDLQAQLELANELDNDSSNTGDMNSALRWYRAAADNGSAEGAFQAAVLLFEQGPAHMAEARMLLESAARAEFALAQIKLADVITTENPDSLVTAQRAFVLYLSAALQNQPTAQYKTATLLQSGRGVEKNLDSAIAWFRRAADQGNAHAQLSLGNMYLTGTGVPTNVAQALVWYEKSARQGSFQAQSNMGDLLTMEHYESIRNVVSGARWYRSAAEQNHAYAQARLGVLYETGVGVERDLQEAAHWYLGAARQGNASAQCRLGSLYLRGSGLAQSSAQAERWFTKAAAQVPTEVLSLVGFMYYDCDQFDSHEVKLNIPVS